MLGRVRTEKPYWDLIENKETLAKPYIPCTKTGVFESYYECMLYLAENREFIICDKELMYADEVRFNYRDWTSYVPYIRCDYVDIPEKQRQAAEKAGILKKYGTYRLGYNNQIENYMLYNKGKYTIDRLYIIDRQCTNVFYVDLTGLPLISPHNITHEAKDLFMRYVAYCYGYFDENDLYDFYIFKLSELSHFEQKFYRKHNLEYYGEYEKINYRQVRKYNLDQILPSFDIDTLQILTPYNIRRIKFEGELFCRCLSGKGYLWDNWQKGSIEKLLTTKDYFCKYSIGPVSLIFKKQWIQHLMKK